MFLVGIAGPFLPYFFLLGVVFVFSTQISAQRVNDAHYLNSILLSGHHIFVPVPSEQFPDGDYLVRLGNSVDLSTNDSLCRPVKRECFRSMVHSQEVEGHVIRFGNYEPGFKNQLIRFYFFGLSPPAFNV
jgi:hypothetical protein